MLKKIIGIWFITVLGSTALLNAQGVGSGSIEDPVRFWPEASPDSMGLNMEALEMHLDICKETNSTACIVAYKGHIVQEWYEKPVYHEIPILIETRSAVKSWTSLLAGMLWDEGKIESLDDPVSKYIPEWESGAEAGVTVRHLLTMTSGIRQRKAADWAQIQAENKILIQAHRNSNEAAFKVKLDTIPGVTYSYSNEGVQLLSPVLERAAGMPLAAYAREKLFTPLDMYWSKMFIDEYYNTVTYADASTTPREFAKIGQLILNNGKWNGKQIISEEYLNMATQPIPQFEKYGYLWWVSEERGTLSAMGSHDNSCIVFPEKELVVVRMQHDPLPGSNGQWQSLSTVNLLQSIVPDNIDMNSSEPKLKDVTNFQSGKKK